MEGNTEEIALLKRSVRAYLQDNAACLPEEALADALLTIGVFRVAGNRRLACSTPLNRQQQRMETKLKYQFSAQELEQLVAFCTDEVPIESSILITLLQLVPELCGLIFRKRYAFDDDV